MSILSSIENLNFSKNYQTQSSLNHFVNNNKTIEKINLYDNNEVDNFYTNLFDNVFKERFKTGRLLFCENATIQIENNNKLNLF